MVWPASRSLISIFRLLLLASSLAAVSAPAVSAQDASSSEAGRDAQSGWTSYLQRRTTELAERSQDALEKVDKMSWPEQSAQWRAELREMLGLEPLPERTELNAKTTGRSEHDGYVVSRVSFESRPGLIVTANLYEPTSEAPSEGWPAVLYVCGHANVRDEGRLLGNKIGYQHHGIWFARHNIVCLIIDTIQLGELHGEHHGTYKLGRWDWMTSGYTPAGVETWNSIRAIDYLETLPSVDKGRIGITGRSGGGAYSWFAAALDERIRAAVPVAGITDLQNHVVDGCVEGHCDCMYFVNYFGWDYNRLAALVAPRALLIGNSDNDRIFPLDGVMRVHRDVAGVYKRLGAADKLGLLLTPGPHMDTQELQVGAFRWLALHLTDQSLVVEQAAKKELAPSQLQVFQHETPAKERLTSVSSWFVPIAEAVGDPSEAAAAWRSKWAAELDRIWPDDTQSELSKDITQSYTLRAQGVADEMQWQWYHGGDVSGWGSSVVTIATGKADRSRPPIVHIGALLGMQLSQASLERALTRGASFRSHLDSAPDRLHIVLSPRTEELLAANLSAREQTHIHRRFYLLGDTAERLALNDIQQQLHWLHEKKSFIEESMELVGHGRWAPLAVLTALRATADEASAEGQPSAKQLKLPQIQRCTLIDYPASLDRAPTLLGLSRVTSFDNLYRAAQGLLEVQTSFPPTASQKSVDESPTDRSSPRPNRLLVDTRGEPQQANGLRIVEVTAESASVWCRATLWPLPNLADLPSVEFAEGSDSKARDRRDPVLPPGGVDALAYGVPGTEADMRVRYRSSGKSSWRESPWKRVTRATDFSTLVPLTELSANTSYEIQVQARAPEETEPSSTLTGTFRTLPDGDARTEFRLAIGTCQEFDDRDGDYGMDVYRTLLHRDAQAFVLAGDVVYYDKLARDTSLAHYHWQRLYSLPTLVNFHRRVPTYFLKDDHDTYVNDSWPGQYHKWTRDFTFADGQRIFREQTGLPDPAYRTIKIGRDLQAWLMEGRDYRDPNPAPDEAMKSIWGAQQWAWLRESLEDSDARFKLIISPTPIVGPDRDNKADNHANIAFAREGKLVREYLSKIPNLVVICGDRHWQYHSVDPATGLHEFSVGPVSNRHAGGWDPQDFRKEIHRFLRVGGGYLEVDLRNQDSEARLTLRHLDPYGKVQHEHQLK